MTRNPEDGRALPEDGKALPEDGDAWMEYWWADVQVEVEAGGVTWATLLPLLGACHHNHNSATAAAIVQCFWNLALILARL